MFPLHCVRGPIAAPASAALILILTSAVVKPAAKISLKSMKYLAFIPVLTVGGHADLLSIWRRTSRSFGPSHEIHPLQKYSVSALSSSGWRSALVGKLGRVVPPYCENIRASAPTKPAL